MSDERKSCLVCPHRCALSEGQSGLCRARAMRDGEMEALRFFAVDEIDLDQISPPIRPVIQRYIQSVK